MPTKTKWQNVLIFSDFTVYKLYNDIYFTVVFFKVARPEIFSRKAPLKVSSNLKTMCRFNLNNYTRGQMKNK